MAAKRCPMCRKTSPDSAMRCECKYEFGQEIAAVLPMLREQQHKGWLTFIGGLIGVIAAIGMIVFAALVGARVWVSGIVLLGSFAAIGRGSSKILRSRQSTRELTERMKLPAARIVER